MIAVTDLWKAFGPRDLFKGAGLHLGTRERVALVGPNGSGKTTLLNMIAGDDQPDRGEIRKSRATLAYLPQETDALRGRSVIDEVMSASPEGTNDYEAKRILAGLGFRNHEITRLCETFSGGWMMRIALAKLLIASPDFLLLDEPTNHLDLLSLEWLEKFLISYPGGILFVSHDRELMNRIATRVVEIDDQRLVSYKGNYDAHLAQKAARLEQLEALAKHQAREIERTQVFIDRFRAYASKARQVQSRVKMLERMDRVQVPKASRRAMGLDFLAAPRTGRVVAELEGVRFRYEESVPVYESLDLVVESDHKAALIGPNGAGKTTLLKILAGALEPQAGSRKLGRTVRRGYFAQHQIEALDPSNSVIEELFLVMPSRDELPSRQILGRFLFSGDDVYKKVSVLSGGERTRLALAKLFAERPNFLCLDEPTNHLDVTSNQIVEEALAEYTGALVLITHDRKLIRNVANRIIEVIDGKITEYHGGYDYYEFKREKAKDRGRAEEGAEDGRAETGRRARDDAERRKRDASTRDEKRPKERELQRIERTLERTSEELAELSKKFADPAIYKSGEDLGAMAKRYELLRRRAERLEAQWDEVAEKIG